MMRIKTYTSESVPQALKMIREELGPGAVILKTQRKVKKRFWGLLPTLAYEITAAADPSAAAQPGDKEPGGAASFDSTAQERGGAVDPRTAERSEISDVRRPRLAAPVETYEVATEPPTPRRSLTQRSAPMAAASPAVPAASVSGPAVADWERRLDALSEEVQSLIRLVSKQRAGDAIASLFLRDAAVAKAMQELIWQGGPEGGAWRSAAFREFQAMLQEGIEESLAFLLIREVTQNFPADGLVEERLRLRLNRAVAKMVKTAPIDANSTGVHLFVGPTGVGKTTTIAKLAARFALKDRRKVRLVTFDTYRIAAAEQLRTYGEIIGVPVSVAFSAEELAREASSVAEGEVVLVDTMGHSHRKVSEYGELADWCRGATNVTTHLVMSATTQAESLGEISACFGVFHPRRLVFTKLDEASRFGIILNEVVRNDKPLSYLTNGQDVAGDLIVPTPGAVADLLVPINPVPHRG
ncbi:MAG: flagellar biosynthesis protein FlhF [Acidobacteriota bacterium]